MKVLWVKRLEDIYIFGKVIGQGTYGRVLKAQNVETKQSCVCKIVHRKSDYVRELDHLIALRKCYGVLPIRQAIFTTSELCMEFEAAECSLYAYVGKNIKKTLINRDLKGLLWEALSVTNQLLISAYHIHANNIIHRDIKSGNVVVTHDEKGIRAWVIDLGMSKRILETLDGNDISHYEIVTATYRAPELWRACKHIKKVIRDNNNKKIDTTTDEDSDDDDSETKLYNHKADIWSIGCILFEMVTGYSPFTGEEEIEVRERIAGHIYHRTGESDTYICSKEHEPLDIEQEIDKMIALFARPPSNINVAPEQPVSKRIECMDLCSSMEEMTVTPNSAKEKAIREKQRERPLIQNHSISIDNTNNNNNSSNTEHSKAIGKHKRTKSEDTKTVISKECETMVIIIKRLLKKLLNPEQEQRPDAELALKEFGRLSAKFQATMEQPVDLTVVRKISTQTRDAFLKAMMNLWVVCNHLHYNPNVVYLGLYMAIRCVTVSSQICKEYSIVTIMLASMRIATSYTGESIRDLRAMRNMISQAKAEKSPKKEVDCASSILTLLKGRVWVKNPGDIRHTRIANCKKNVWNEKIEQTLFSVMMTMLTTEFSVPDSEVVVYRALRPLNPNDE